MSTPRPKQISRKPGRQFRLYLADGAIREVEGKSLAAAIAEAGIDEGKTEIIAAVERCCLATARDDSMPALVAIICNPGFAGKVNCA